MNFMFRRKLTQAVRTNLMSGFNLGPESLAKLCALETNGRFAGRKVRLVRVFDPSLISSGVASKLKYQDLEKAGDRGALRFEGHAELNGPIYLADRRPKAADGVVQDSL